MNHLARFLETLYTAADDMSYAVDARISHWRHDQPDGTTNSGRPIIGKKRPKTGANAGTVTSSIHAQLRLPTHARIVTRRSSSSKTRESLVVMNPDEWHIDTGKGSAEHGSEDCPYLADVQRHFDATLIRQLLVGLRLEDQGPTSFLETECVSFRAFPRAECQLWPHWLPSGADHYEFIGDVSTGILLSIAGIRNNQTFEQYEITEIEHDVAFDDMIFSFNSASVDVIESAQQAERMVSLEAVQSQVEFDLHAPKGIPDLETSRVEYILRRRDSVNAPHVMLMYSGTSRCEHLWIEQAAAPDPDEDDYEWEDVSLPNTAAKISDPGDAGMRIVKLVKNETHIAIISDLDRVDALEIATSLVPCATGE